jgi:putative intracellular protease/amidase
MKKLSGKTVAILATLGFEEAELVQPKAVLERLVAASSHTVP